MSHARLTRAGAREVEALVALVFGNADSATLEAAKEALEKVDIKAAKAAVYRKVGALKGLLCFAVETEHDALCQLLTSHHPTLRDEQLIIAAECGKEARVRQLLKQGIPANATDHLGRTPLIALAAFPGSPERALSIARLLLEAGCPVNAATPEGITALQLSVLEQHYSLASLLVDAGADIAAPTALENLPLLHMLVATAPSGYSFLPPSEDLSALARQLVAAGADVDVRRQHEGTTPLCYAVLRAGAGGLCSKPLLSLIDTLLDLGADAAAEDDSGKSVLVNLALSLGKDRWVETGTWVRLLRRLVEAGADINAQMPPGFSPLAIVCTRLVMLYGVGICKGMIQAMVEVGADITADQPLPLLMLVLQTFLEDPDSTRASCVIRALADVGYPFQSLGAGPVHVLLRHMFDEGRNGRLPSFGELRCLDALLESGCQLAEEIPPGQADPGHAGDAAWWLAKAALGRSMPVVLMLLKAFPGLAQERTGEGWTVLEVVARSLHDLVVRSSPQEVASPLEGPLGEAVVWFCRLAPVLLDAGSPPPCPCRLDIDSMPAACRRTLSFLAAIASGAPWFPEQHSTYPPAFREAARQLVLANECRGFVGPPPAEDSAATAAASGGVQTRSGRSRLAVAACSGAGRGKRRRGGKRGAAPLGVQLPPDLLHRILQQAAQPVVEWVPGLLPRIQRVGREGRHRFFGFEL